MNYYIIEPRDPLIFRDGRPFNNTPGARARTLEFPLPQTVAGAFRTRYWLGQGNSFSPTKPSDSELQELSALKEKSIKGPILVELDKEGKVIRPLFSYPADSLPLKDEKGNIEIKRLVPLDISGSFTNLPDGLNPVGLPKVDEAKKPEALAKYWYWSEYLKWLKAEQVNKENIGHDGPTKEYRSHVKLTDDTLTASEGELFQTSALEFTNSSDTEKTRLAMLIATREELNPGYGHLGGEKRLVKWQNTEWEAPQIPKDILEQIKIDKACRLVLLTPAIFKDGYRSGNQNIIFNTVPDLKVTLKAVAIARHQTISGWDYAQRAPKPSRRIALAGTVFFIELDGSDEQIENWAKKIWWSNISDNDQDRKDGFGLAVLGTWSGEPEELEVT